MDDIRGDKCRQTPARVKGVDKYEGKVVFNLIREASIRWKCRQILQLFFVTKINVSFLSLLKGCIQVNKGGKYKVKW